MRTGLVRIGRVGASVLEEYEFMPWVTPLLARLFDGPFPVGGVLVYGPDEQACRAGRAVALEYFYGLSGIREVNRAEEA